MVAQANAQSDHYSADEDSEDEWDQYGGRYEDHVAEEHEEQESGVPPFRAFSALGPAAHVSAEYCSTQQGGGVSRPCGDTRLAGTQPQQQAPGSGDSGAEGSRAGRAGDAGPAEPYSRYSTGKNQLTCSIGQRQHSYARKQGQQPCSIVQGQRSFTTSR